jgi:hypothetical protein
MFIRNTHLMLPPNHKNDGKLIQCFSFLKNEIIFNPKTTRVKDVDLSANILLLSTKNVLVFMYFPQTFLEEIIQVQDFQQDPYCLVGFLLGC